MHGNEVGGLQQLLQAARDADLILLHDVFVDKGIEGDDTQAERLGALGDQARNVAERDESQGLALQPCVLGKLLAALAPAAFTHDAVLADEAAPAGEQQGHGMVGNFLDEHVRHVGDDDARACGGGNVHVVEADARTRDHLALFQCPQDFRCQAHAAANDGVGVLGLGDEGVLVRGIQHDDFRADGFKGLAFHLVVAAAEIRQSSRHLSRNNFERCHQYLPDSGLLSGCEMFAPLR